MPSSTGPVTPSAAAVATSSRHFRLRGRIEGRDRTFSLRRGLNLIGRSTGCDVRLSSKGVSFRHARLTVGPASPWLEDLASKNGSFVNGSQVRTAQLAPGDALWFGSVELTLERIESGDTLLAVDLTESDETNASETAAGATATRRRWLNRQAVEGWLGAVAAVGQGPSGPDELQAALGSVAAALGVRSAVVLELRDEIEVVLAACGELDRRLPARLRGWLATTPPAPEGIAFDASTGPKGESLTAVARLAADSPPLALCLTGEFGGRGESRSLLTLLVRLIEQRLRSSADVVPVASGGLQGSKVVFPSGYVPGISAAMRRLHAQIEPLVDSDLPALIRGETGVGKEWVARILHRSSSRRRGPFVALNCAAVPAELLEAELFGIGKGVATGVNARRGRFLEAQGGTLFLDEIGDLPPALQPKLLRVLESGELYPVGGSAVTVDVRILAATNTDLAKEQDDRFRSDLYYRLAGVDLLVPPLRQRREDIPMLVEHYLRRFSRDAGKAIRGMTVNALRSLLDYPWPGNIRELVHELRRLAYVCPVGQAIEVSHLADQVVRGRQSTGAISTGATPPAPGAAHAQAEAIEVSPAGPPAAPSFADWLATASDLRLERIECAVLAEALGRTGGNQAQAGRLLGISRMAVHRRLKRCSERGFCFEAGPAAG